VTRFQLSPEHAMLASEAPDHDRTRIFAHYSLIYRRHPFASIEATIFLCGPSLLIAPFLKIGLCPL
jgi:hypothetical protein